MQDYFYKNVTTLFLPWKNVKKTKNLKTFEKRSKKIQTKYNFFFSSKNQFKKKHNSYRGEGGSPQSDCIMICRAKPKNRIFANGQFSGHLIFYKKNFFFRRQKFFYSYKQKLYFFEKKHFSFFWKKMFFVKICFSKKLKKNIHKLFMGRKRFEILKKNFQKKEKCFFSKK